MRPRVNYTSRMLMWGGDRGLEEVSTVFRFPSTVANAHHSTRDIGVIKLIVSVARKPCDSSNTNPQQK